MERLCSVRRLTPLAMLFIALLLKTIQSNGQIKPLRIGDTIPEVEISNIKNHSSGSLKMSDLSGKLVIIDFWNKGCSVCINGFPKMEYLQEVFGDKIQVLLVTDDKQEALAGLFKSNPNLKNVKLPIVIGDTILHKLFPHTGVPYHVWIDAKGIVKATTVPGSTTAGNIRLFLEGKKINLPVRVDAFSPSEVNEWRGKTQLEQLCAFSLENNLLSYSMFTKRNTLLPYSDALMKRDSSNLLIGLTITNSDIIYLFEYAYNWTWIKKEIIEVKDSHNLRKYFLTKINIDEKSVWEYENTFCYEVRIPPSSVSSDNDQNWETLRSRMRKDLETNFSIKSSIEKRAVKCLVISRLPGKDRLKSKGGEEVYEPTKDGTWILRNISFSAIQNPLRSYLLQVHGPNDAAVVIDETGIKQDGSYNIDADIKLYGWKELSEVKKSFAKFGLDIKEETRLIDCLILKEE